MCANTYILALPHALRACDKTFFIAKKKKKKLCFYFIYNFYIENLIYKWIKQFKNQ